MCIRDSNNGTMTEEESENIVDNFKSFLDKEFDAAKSYNPNKADWLEGTWTGLSTATFDARRGKTSVKKNELIDIAKKIAKEFDWNGEFKLDKSKPDGVLEKKVDPNLGKKLFGTSNERELSKLKPIIQKVNDLEEDIIKLENEVFPKKTEELIRKFKHDIQWENIQFGVLGDFEEDAIKVASGTTQLDDFVKEDITEEGPPELLFIEPEENLNFTDDFEDEEEAIEIANDTDYGLANYVQTQDKEKVKRVARKLRSGMVDVNGVGIAVASPFGGYKHSGIGREAGIEGLIEFLEVKTVGGWN